MSQGGLAAETERGVLVHDLGMNVTATNNSSSDVVIIIHI